jgi:predicted RNA binding protein YcfA (HicA-like mRNA interferase family)
MPKIVPLKFGEVVAKLKKLWYDWPLYGGKHPIMKKNWERIPVPKHGWKDVSQGVIACIVQQLWIDVKTRNWL